MPLPRPRRRLLAPTRGLASRAAWRSWRRCMRSFGGRRSCCTRRRAKRRVRSSRRRRSRGFRGCAAPPSLASHPTVTVSSLARLAPPADGGPAIELFAPAFAAEVREIVRDAAHSIALLRGSAHFDVRLPAGPLTARAARAAAAVPDGDGDVCEGLPRLWLVWGVHRLAGVRRYWAGTHAELRARLHAAEVGFDAHEAAAATRRRRRQSDAAPRSALRSRRPTRRWRRGWRRSVS